MGWLLNLIPFFGNITNAIESITGKIVDLKVVQAKAATDQERIHTEENIKVLEAQRDVLMQQSARDSHLTMLVRIGLMFPVACLMWKFLIWDMVVGSFMGCAGPGNINEGCTTFITDNPQPNLWWFIFMVGGFFFTQSISTIWKRP